MPQENVTADSRAVNNSFRRTSLWPWEFHLYQEQTFDSFTKRVIKSIAIDIHNAEAARSKKERSLSDLSYKEASKLAVEDTYHIRLNFPTINVLLNN